MANIKMARQQQLRRTAYHEAGHAVMMWFFALDIECIDMRRTATNYGAVETESLDIENWIRESQASGQSGKFHAARGIMIFLAGLCAENRAHENSPAWLQNAVEEYSQCRHDETHDLSRVWGIMAACHPDRKQGIRFARVVKKWVDEAFTIPELWAAVESLAKIAMKADVLDGPHAFQIIQQAVGWNTSRNAPYVCAGPRWKRRFQRFAVTTKKT
ncbi:MAG: hypothetical protein JWM11_990 [Planctomycetaceae bacterium]|nr:hypothetical protein [Planctomycetaceae bacterium]